VTPRMVAPTSATASSQAISKVNPLSYELDALRGLLIGTQAHIGRAERSIRGGWFMDRILSLGGFRPVRYGPPGSAAG
jgi:hypothetical protein